MREYFSQDEAKDAARLAPCKDDNEVLRKTDRKVCLLFIRFQYYSIVLRIRFWWKRYWVSIRCSYFAT